MAIDGLPKHNPFDFSNPVDSASKFVGREEEMKEIKYYLSHATNNPKPINLVLMGPRSVGKSSLLNMVEQDARKENFVLARLALNESDSSALAFFSKLFRSVISSAVAQPKAGISSTSAMAFGGDRGKVFELYQKMTLEHKLPTEDEALWSPFRFPEQYARTMQTADRNTSLDETVFRNDLKLISKEVGKRFCVLVDEGDILGTNRTTLQMFRNLLMDLDGYMFVIAATPSFFDAMNVVFSPIARQFKRIQVKPFSSPSEIIECLVQPLVAAGVKKPFRLYGEHTIDEMIRLGRGGMFPYEIQLICHHMFKDVQLGRKSQMELNSGILDAVLTDIQPGGKESLRSSICEKIRALDKLDLAALSLLCFPMGGATIEEIQFATRVFFGVGKDFAQKLSVIASRLEAQGLIKEEKGLIRLAGDEFDRLFLKYFGQQKKPDIPIQIMEWPFSKACGLMLIGFLEKGRELKFEPIIRFPLDTDGRGLRDSMIQSLQALGSEKPNSFCVFAKDEDSHLVRGYELLFEKHCSGVPNVTLVWLELSSKVFNGGYLFATGGETKDLEIGIGELCARGEEWDLRVETEMCNIAVPKEGAFAEVIEGLPTGTVRKDVGLYHQRSLFAEYVKRRETSRALEHAKVIAGSVSNHPGGSLNNAGYLFLTLKAFEDARRLFVAALATDDGLYQRALREYNAAMAEVMLGQVRSAIGRLDWIKTSIPSFNTGGMYIDCLLALSKDGSGFILEEVFEADIADCTQRAIDLLQS